jgi:hypothetical protein
MYVRRSELVTTGGGSKLNLLSFFFKSICNIYSGYVLGNENLNYPICSSIENADGNVTPGNVKQIPFCAMY